ncbi:MAG: SRPBCC family protein [Deltaproteobacteria bacterium]|nr:SRPBCC family protein [Candidatus Deferrimicrobium borealis]
MTPSYWEVQHLPISLPEAWSFFSDPRNLSRITPPSLGLEVTSDLPGVMYPGMIVTYNVRPIPWVSVGWVTEITHVREPVLFVDEQRFGPYRFWHHEHHFREVEGGVEMEDIVHYALPFGTIGRVFGGPLVRRRLEQIFSFRRRFLVREFGLEVGG